MACRRSIRVGPLGALALGAGEHLALGGQLGGELRTAAGVRPLVGRGAAALDLGLDPALLLGRLVERPDRGPVGGDQLLAAGLGARSRPAPARSSAARASSSAWALASLARDQPLAAVALGEHAILADRRRLAQLPRGRRPHAPGLGHRDAVEADRRAPRDRRPPTCARSSARASAERRLAAADVVDQPLGAGAARRPATAPVSPRARHQRTAALAAGSVEQLRAGVAVLDDRGPEPPVERRRERELVARVDVELVGQRRGRPEASRPGGAGTG